jgi:ribosome maturation factor RimP
MTGIGERSIAEQARTLLEPILARDGYELVEVEWVRGAGRWTLRVFIDKQGGVNIDDCQAVSRTVEPILDVEDFIEPAYDLEVSSPGLDRPLRKPQDFDRYRGQRAHGKA